MAFAHQGMGLVTCQTTLPLKQWYLVNATYGAAPPGPYHAH